MPFEKIENILCTERWPANIKCPAWEDLKDRIHTNEAFFDQVLSCLKKRHIALVLSPAKQGKTFMTYAIAFHLKESKEEDWVVEYASAPDIEYDKEVTGIEKKHKWRRSVKCLYIIEDCHKLPNDAEKFLKWALRAGKGACHLLFTMRGFSEDELSESVSLLSKKGCVIPLIPGISHIKDIIRSYIDCIRSKYQRSSHLNPSEEELEEFIEDKVGTDLDRLTRFLTEAWDPDQQSLKNVSEDKILRDVWEKFCLDDPKRRELLSLLSALGQFDVNMYAPFLENLPSAEQLQNLVKEGLIKKRKGPVLRYYEMADSKDSDYVLKGIACDQRVDYEDYSADLIRKYVTSKPPNTILLFLTLWRSQKKELINTIFKDSQAMIALQEELAGRSLNTKLRVATYLEIISGDLAHSLFSHAGLREELKEETKGAPAQTIRNILAALGGADSKRRFFTPWSPSDYAKTIKSTAKLNTLRLLFYDFQMSDLRDIAGKFAEHLPEADWGSLLDPANETSLVDLNKLIGNLRFIPKELSLLFQKLPLMDLSTPISKAEPKDVGWLLWQMLQFGYFSASSFVQRHKRVLSELLLRSKPAEAFWILWDIFQADKESACDLVKSKDIGSLLQRQISSTEALQMGLASLTLLYLCGMEPTDLRLPQAKLEEIVYALNNKTDASLSALSLKALMLRLDKEELHSIKTKVNLAAIGSRVSSFPITETKKLLQDMLDEFRSDP
jgi:hypothetical protein